MTRFGPSVFLHIYLMFVLIGNVSRNRKILQTIREKRQAWFKSGESEIKNMICCYCLSSFKWSEIHIWIVCSEIWVLCYGYKENKTLTKYPIFKAVSRNDTHFHSLKLFSSEIKNKDWSNIEWQRSTVKWRKCTVTSLS